MSMPTLNSTYNPRVTAACDVILANCYPFWEGCPADHCAAVYERDVSSRAVDVANGKKVIISETGWPNVGTRPNGARPVASRTPSSILSIPTSGPKKKDRDFLLLSFDETWKVDAEGDVGAYWGLWDKDGNSKYS